MRECECQRASECEYVCVDVTVIIRVRASMHVCMRGRVHDCVQLGKRLHVRVCNRTARLCMYVRTQVCVLVGMRCCIHVHMRVCMHV